MILKEVFTTLAIGKVERSPPIPTNERRRWSRD